MLAVVSLLQKGAQLVQSELELHLPSPPPITCRNTFIGISYLYILVNRDQECDIYLIIVHTNFNQYSRIIMITFYSISLKFTPWKVCISDIGYLVDAHCTLHSSMIRFKELVSRHSCTIYYIVYTVPPA